MSYFQEHMSLRKNKSIGEMAFLLLSAFVIVMLASRSSFLYPCNDWNDANSFFTVGKAFMNGKVPYRDVFDQKGIYTYLFYGLAYLISHTTFMGVFLLEVIFAAFDLWGIFRVLQLYVQRSTALALAPLTLAAAFSSNSFYWGGSAEEIYFPFLVWGLYLALDYFKNHYPETMCRKTLFIGGLLAGVIANIKYTGLGFFFAWMMCAAFAFLARKDFMGAVKACLVFLLGMAVPFLPWLIYFSVRGGLYEWYYAYVYINIFVYSDLTREDPSFYGKIYALAKLLYWIIRKNLIYFGFVIPGVLWSIFGRKRRMLERFMIFALCFFLFLGIYIGESTLPYYSFPLSVFTVLGFALLGRIFEWMAGKWNGRSTAWAEGKAQTAEMGQAAGGAKAGIYIAPFLSLMVCVGMILGLSMNIPHMKEKKEDIFLYKFKEIVEQTENPTLLNISCLDAGLYTVCDIVPTCRWFQTQPLLIDDVLKVQEQYIREGRTDYIIARDEYPDVILEKYELVAQEPWYQDGTEFIYYLFRLKE